MLLVYLMKWIMITIICCVIYDYSSNGNIHYTEYVLSGFNVNQEVHLSMSDIITRRGYTWREYSVTTDDGYILTLQRIGGNRTYRSLPVFMQHGLLTSSVDWLIGSNGTCLACRMADEGFDVWLGNLRGNLYSHNHTTFSPDDPQFWDFSFDEHARFDLSAMVHFVTEHTSRRQLILIGHSQGALISLIQLSRDTWFADKVALFAALAPAVSFRGTHCPMVSLSPYYTYFYAFIGRTWFLNHNQVLAFVGRTVCANRLLQPICLFIIGLFNGFNTHNIDLALLPTYLQFQPSSTSVKNMVHFAQVIMGGRLRLYDYMSEETNLRVYNKSTPPEYDLTSIPTPVIFVASEDDWLCPADNLRELVAALPNVVQCIWLRDFAHLDFILGRQVVKAVHSPLISTINKYITDF